MKKSRIFSFKPAAALLAASLAPCFLNAGTASPPGEYLEVARMLVRSGLTRLDTFPLLRRIISVGPRLTGSPEAEAAVRLCRSIMEESGFDNVLLEPAEVPHWVRGGPAVVNVRSKNAGEWSAAAAAIGGSIPTPPDGITAPVLEVGSFDELRRKRDEARGRIVFFNRPMNPAYLDPFRAYGEAAPQRSAGAVEAARVGAKAVLVRSLTLSLDEFPHTGMLKYSDDAPPLPAATLSTHDAERLSAALRADPDLRLFMRLDCRRLENVDSFNVVGEIAGFERPGEIILLGGHLDSWDLSPGAHDDGAGCAQAIAALRLIRACGLRPRRTIRAVLFMNEEFGGSGGSDYAASPLRRKETHLAALESDRGGFLPIALGIGGGEKFFARIKRWEPVFQEAGLQRLQPGGGGVDIGPLGRSGTLLCSLIPDPQRYFDLHHSSKDVLETVHPRELELGTVAMALWAYIMAQEFPGI